MTVKVCSSARGRDAAAVLMVHRTSIGAGVHVGIEYADSSTGRVFAHMAWHMALEFGAPVSSGF